MDKLLKNAFTWLGVASIIIAFIVVGISNALHPSCKLVDKLQKAMDKRDAKKMAACFEPEAKEEILLTSTIENELGEGFGFSQQMYYAGVVRDYEDEELKEGENPTKTIRCIMVGRLGLDIEDVHSEDIEIVKIGRKEYFEY